MQLSKFYKVLFLLLLVTAPFTAIAQTYRGGIGGTVVDATGAVVPNARVELTSTDTGTTRDTETTSAGTYVFQDLQIGHYTVAVTAVGFGTETFKDIAVNPGAITSVNPKLSVSGTQEVVDIATDTTSEIQTQASANNAVIGEKAVANIPLNGRDFTQLVKLAPGVNGGGSVNGTRSTQNNYQIDGADNNDIWQDATAANQGGVGPIAGVTLPIEAIDQFNLQTNGNAEAGRNPGGLISLGIKTGTNQFHGSGYFYTRNEFFSARDFFQTSISRKQKLRNQQFGGSIGGPIFKDKLFFFLNYERQKYDIQLPSSSATEPGTAYVGIATALLQKHNFTVNPLSTALLAALYPGAGNSSLSSTPNNYAETHPQYGYSDNFIGNLNYILSPKQTIRLQAYIGTGRQFAPSGTNVYEYFQVAPDITQNFSMSHNWAVTDHFSNQLLIAVGVFNQTFNDENHSFNMPALGLNTGVTNPTLFGAPTITMTGFDTTGATQPLGRKDYTGHITDSATWVHGKHEFRFGGEFRRNYIDLQYQSGSRGNFTFPGTMSANLPACGVNVSTSSQPCLTASQTAYSSSGSSEAPLASDTDVNPNKQTEVLSLADFLVGNFSTASFLQGNVRRDLYRTDLGFFIQDQYKVMQKLTLNLGVRHEYTGDLSSTGTLSEFRPGVAGANANGLILVGTPGHPSTYNAGKLHFSPRVGFNYAASSKLAIRGSYGIYFDAPAFNGFGNSSSGFTSASSATGLQTNPIGGVLNVSLPINQWVTNQYVWSNAAGASTLPLFSVNPNLHMAYSNNFGLTTEYQLSRTSVLTVGYTGATGTHLYGMLDANQPAPWSTSAPSNPASPTLNCALTGNVGNATCLQVRRPYYSAFPNVGAVVEVNSRNMSNYNSLVASLKTSGFHGFTGQLSYTYGHALDNGSAFRSTGPIDSTNLRLDYGSSTFDSRHTINGYVVYEIRGSHALPALTKGWQVTGFTTFYTSTPINITAGDFTGIGMNKDRVNWSGANYKLNTKNVTLRSGTTTKIVQWWVPLAQTPFSAPAFGSHGNTGRDEFRGPNFFTFDSSLVKNTPIHDKISFQLRADIFNVFNFMNMGKPTTTYNSANFGQITAGNYSTGISSGAPFNVQFAGKLIF